jgi:uncharacterized protein YggU (UPF0235/DUF167 family)
LACASTVPGGIRLRLKVQPRARRVAKSAISVVSGATDRRKLVEIRGNSGDLGESLDRLIKDLGRNDDE